MDALYALVMSDGFWMVICYAGPVVTLINLVLFVQILRLNRRD